MSHFLSVLLILFFSCTANQTFEIEMKKEAELSNKDNSIFVKGDGKSIFPLVSADPWDYNRMTTYFVIDSSEYGEIKIGNNEFAFFYCGIDLVPYLLRNGDTLVVSIKNGKSEVTSINKNNFRNIEINFFKNAINSRIPLLYHETRNMNAEFGLKPNFSIQNYHSLESKFNQFNENLYRNSQFSNDAKEYYDTYTKYNLIAKALMFGNKELKEFIINNHNFESLTINKQNFQNVGFRGFIYQFFKAHPDVEKLPINLYESELFVLFKLMEVINGNEKGNISQYLSNHNNKILNDYYDGYLQLNTKDKYELVLKPNQVQNLNGDIINFDSIMKNGRIKFIDFWASWCAPCRAEMAASKSLKSKFLNENLDFIFISIDKSQTAWIKASEFEGISSHQLSYIIRNPDNFSIYDELKISTIPRYIIVDGNGTILNKNASSPSNKALYLELKGILEKKG